MKVTFLGNRLVVNPLAPFSTVGMQYDVIVPPSVIMDSAHHSFSGLNGSEYVLNDV